MYNVVVTGGAGFVGRHLATTLLKRGCMVTIIDNLSSGSPGAIEELKIVGKDLFCFYKNDIMDLDSVREIFEMNKFDACVHLAGKTSVLDSLNSPNETTQCNIKGTLNLLEASYQTDLSTFVFASSAAVYGNTTRLPLSEGSPPSPISHYGATKVVGEELVRCYSLKINACISLRLFNVYGTGQNASYAGVITKFRERLYDGLPPVIYGDGTQRRDFISVKDAVRAIVLAAELKTRNSKSPFIFNIGTGTSKSIGELATLMINMSRQYSLRPVYLGGVQEDICNRREAGGLP